MNFNDLGLIDPLLKALKDEGYQSPTSIQEDAIPALLAGRDLLATAQTGTGKTAAFAVPILQHLFQIAGNQKHHQLRVLILAPTRELVAQIKESFLGYGAHLPFTTVAIFGGVPKAGQIKAIRKGCDILVATPGRLFDVINSIDLDLNHIKFFVLDEADRMLDMGFARDVEKIVTYLPEEKQTMLFSATMPKEIISLANKLLNDPLTLRENPKNIVVNKIAQAVYQVGRRQKKDLLVHLLQDPVIYQALVFSRTKRGADRISKTLKSYGISNATLHGNKSQNIREQALKAFKHNDVRVLVATDIAARGIDIQELSHVINYDIPEDSETYVHRIGRTGRAGFSGTALSFCEPGEVRSLRDIEKLIGEKIPVIKDHPYETTFKNQALDLTGILPEPVHPLEEEETQKPRGERVRRASPTPRKRSVRKDDSVTSVVDTFFHEDGAETVTETQDSPKIFKRKSQSDVYSESEKETRPSYKSGDRFAKRSNDRFGGKERPSTYRGSRKPANTDSANDEGGSQEKPRSSYVRKPRSDSARYGESSSKPAYRGERKSYQRNEASSDKSPSYSQSRGSSYPRKRSEDGAKSFDKPYGEKKSYSSESRPRKTYGAKSYGDGEKRSYGSSDSRPRKSYGAKSFGDGESKRSSFDRAPRVNREEGGESSFRTPRNDSSRSYGSSERRSTSPARGPRSESRFGSKNTERSSRDSRTGSSKPRSYASGRRSETSSAKKPYQRRKD